VFRRFVCLREGLAAQTADPRLHLLLDALNLGTPPQHSKTQNQECMNSENLMPVSFRQIRNFLAVAEAGKMSQAAFALGISQSAITEAVKALEMQAGAPLFRRHRAGVTLTNAGYQFLRHART
jgi:hypothetical protein